MTDPMHDRVVVAVGQDYDVGEEIGRGGMALVYRATDLRLRRDVAIKVLPPELAFRPDVRQRFLREAQTAAQLNHPNIVSIYSVDERDGLVYFAMALVEGESLASRLARGPLPIDEARRVLRDVADALDYAHAHGVIHRDIKPDNILLDRRTGRPMVTDFGIARAAEADSRLTVTGIAVGTPAYMSPEQTLGERDVDGRSDIYSLGVVAYQLLTGVLPFRAANTPAMMMKHLSETPRPVREVRPDVPPALAVAVERALAKRPEDRWSDAGAFRDAIVSDRVPRPVWEPLAPPAALPAAAAPDARGRAGVDPRARDHRRGYPLPPAPPAPAPGDVHRELIEASIRYAVSRRESRRMRRAALRGDPEAFAALSVDQRVMTFRRNLASAGTMVGALAAINLLTSPHVPWFIFAAFGIGVPVLRQWSGLWADGIGWRRVFGNHASQRAGGGALAAGASPGAAGGAAEAAAAKMVPAAVLAGRHGGAVRRAAADRIAILAIVDSLAKPDRELLPEVVPTVDALAERAASLAQTLHHLDADVSPSTMTELETRIAQVKAEPEHSPDRERRLALLDRQYTSLRELADRRARLGGRLESALLALQNLKLDLLKLRSSGVQSAINEVNSATVEARALSREIGHVLDAADEVRKL